MVKKSMIIAVSAIFAQVIITGGCTTPSKEVNETEKATIAVSIPPLGYFARTIGGDSLDVNILIEGSGDPETFQPGMGAMKELNKGGVLIVTGLLPFENELVRKIESNNENMTTYNASDGITLMYGTHHHSDHEKDHDHGDEVGEPDPHIWSSVKNARIIAKNIKNAITEQYPEHTAYFNARYETLDSTLQAIDLRLTEEIGGKDGCFLVWHPSLSYFARDYGLQQIAVSMENKETTSRSLSEILRQSAQTSPRAFFISEGSNPSGAQTICSHTGIKPTEVNFLDGDWERHITIIEKALAK